MKNAIINIMQDLSDKDRFVFSVECAVCGKKWTSTPEAFSKAGEHTVIIAKEIALRTLYQHEKQQAALNAVNEAKSSFNFCPVCKTLVCDSCFMICDDTDICINCAQTLHFHGEPVDA